MRRAAARSEQIANAERSAQSGFSLLELLITLMVMLFVMAAASQLVVSAFRVRSREDKRGEALADARRALDTMTHEIASAGYKLPSGLSLPSNGIVSANSSSTAIRFVTNTGSTNTSAVNEANEDVMYKLTTDASGNSFITRYDMNSGPSSSILGNRIDNLTIRYYDQIVRYTAVNTTAAPCDISTGGTAESTNKALSTYIVISACVTLPQVGTAGADGYQAASTVQMTSDVFLRNTSLTSY
jgi:prepilin-type N-terminal cleavage/methylation domain-containing protein